MSRRFMNVLGTLFLIGFLAAPLGAQKEKPSVMGHELEGKENCMMCHAAGVMEPVPDVPADHEGRGNETCLWCHAADSPMQTTGASETTHEIEGKENCVMCHAAGVMPPVPDVPENHEGRDNNTCLWCHKVAGG